MKELSGTARNYCLAETQDGYIPQVEFIMVVTEPQYHFVTSEMIRERVPETWRLSMSKKSLAELMRTLAEIADEMAALEIDAAAATKIASKKKDVAGT
jgi:ribosomal protein S3AE